ncbi:MAG TPA: S8 family serine peptidase [Candidatus Stackebrandtia faecavium]|nr:S8 family serine peptidase [Candidatus Stackebrandtia faecavium]
MHNRSLPTTTTGSCAAPKTETPTGDKNEVPAETASSIETDSPAEADNPTGHGNDNQASGTENPTGNGNDSRTSGTENPTGGTSSTENGTPTEADAPVGAEKPTRAKNPAGAASGTAQSARAGDAPRPLRSTRSRSWVVSVIAAAAAVAVTVAIVVVVDTVKSRDDAGNQWYLDELQMEKVHELSQGEGVDIGVIDSGVDAQHPNLNVTGGEAVEGGTEDGMTDATGHGTAVASVTAGTGEGVDDAEGLLGIAPKANIISVGVKPRSNYLGDAIDYLVELQVDVILIGQVAKRGDDANLRSPMVHNIPVVAPTGNVDYGLAAGWPANRDHVIPVAGTDRDGASWQDSHKLPDSPDVTRYGMSAPATDIPAAAPGSEYTYIDDTAASAAIVAGTIALIKSAYPKILATSVLTRLLSTTDDGGASGYDDRFGWGTVNPYKALTEDINYTMDGKTYQSKASDRIPLAQQNTDVELQKTPGLGPSVPDVFKAPA